MAKVGMETVEATSGRTTKTAYSLKYLKIEDRKVIEAEKTFTGKGARGKRNELARTILESGGEILGGSMASTVKVWEEYANFSLVEKVAK